MNNFDLETKGNLEKEKKEIQSSIQERYSFDITRNPFLKELIRREIQEEIEKIERRDKILSVFREMFDFSKKT